MSTMQETLNAALLADAAYLEVSLSIGQTLSGEALAAALRAAPNFSDHPLTETEIASIAGQYDLVATQMSGLGGFQAMVFRHHGMVGQPGEFVMAIRGTQGLLDIAADISFEILSTALGQEASALTFTANLIKPISQGGWGLPIYDGSLDVTGHSLGGHLVQELVADRPQLINKAYTFNGAGYGLMNVLQALRAGWAISQGAGGNVTNIIGEGGLEVIPSFLSDVQLGSSIRDLSHQQYAYASTNAGMSVSYITGDAGANVICNGVAHFDDAVLGIFGEYQMAPAMGSDHIDAGGGNALDRRFENVLVRASELS